MSQTLTKEILDEAWERVLKQQEATNGEFTLFATPEEVECYKEYAKHTIMRKTPKCECGAHKVKDSAHADWCDLKAL